MKTQEDVQQCQAGWNKNLTKMRKANGKATLLLNSSFLENLVDKCLFYLKVKIKWFLRFLPTWCPIIRWLVNLLYFIFPTSIFQPDLTWSHAKHMKWSYPWLPSHSLIKILLDTIHCSPMWTTWQVVWKFLSNQLCNNDKSWLPGLPMLQISVIF